MTQFLQKYGLSADVPALEALIESVKADFDENSAMYKLADALFREENNPGKLVCIPVQASSSDD